MRTGLWKWIGIAVVGLTIMQLQCGKTSEPEVGDIAGTVTDSITGEMLSGVTVTGFSDNTARYMDIKDAIKQREVSLHEVSIFEQLGFCFGRVREEYEPLCKKEKRFPQRIY